MSKNLPRRIQRELQKHNSIVGNKVDEIMQQVMADPKIQDRSDWDQIQKTLGLIVSSMSTSDFSDPYMDDQALIQPTLPQERNQEAESPR